MPAQDPHTGRVKGADPDALRAKSYQLVHTLPHLSCRLIGKCDGQDIPWIHLLFIDQIGHPVGQHPGLAGTRSGQDQQRPIGVKHSLLLHWI